MPKRSIGKARGRISRRHFLKGVSTAAGLAAGSGAIGGLPTIWAQNIKGVSINHAGPPVTAIPRIAEQASKDLGFTVHMQASENADLLNRFLSQSNAIDVADISLPYLRYVTGRNVDLRACLGYALGSSLVRSLRHGGFCRFVPAFTHAPASPSAHRAGA